MNEKCTSFWQKFLQKAGLPANTEPLEVFHFTDSKEFADSLAEVTIAGKKTATASLLWEFEANNIDVPQPGDLSLVTYANGEPACVIETTAVNIVPFNQVTAEFAATEGEVDPSLAHWRECHWREFSDLCVQLGRVADETMPVICEGIKAVYF